MSSLGGFAGGRVISSKDCKSLTSCPPTTCPEIQAKLAVPSTSCLPSNALNLLNESLNDVGVLTGGELFFFTRVLQYKITFGAAQYEIERSNREGGDRLVIGTGMRFDEASDALKLYGPFVSP